MHNGRAVGQGVSRGSEPASLAAASLAAAALGWGRAVGLPRPRGEWLEGGGDGTCKTRVSASCGHARLPSAPGPLTVGDEGWPAGRRNGTVRRPLLTGAVDGLLPSAGAAAPPDSVRAAARSEGVRTGAREPELAAR